LNRYVNLNLSLKSSNSEGNKQFELTKFNREGEKRKTGWLSELNNFE
jgi:hypothetical protein